jgi:hypothetical protein
MGDMEYFTRLGTLVEQRWAAKGRRPGELAEIAVAALSDVPVPPTLSPTTVLGLLATGTDVPKQLPSADTFGQPPAVMFQSVDLEIQAITWMEGTTSIHQHGFDGAFRVMHGSSLHVEYAFRQDEALADAHLITGHLDMGNPEILQPGDVRPIIAGPNFIHALFHLERPSMTVVVRNNSSELPFPQYNYRLPGLGIDGLYRDDRLTMRLRGLHSLHQVDRVAALEVALDIAATQDLWTAFRVCDDWGRNFGAGADLAALVELVGGRHPSLSELLEPMYAEDIRRGQLLARRGMLRQPHHRLFMALIVNLPDRRSINSAIAQAFPGEDPDLLILKWVRELASPEYRGISGLSLGSEDFEVLQGQLAGSASDTLTMVASRWKPPSVLEKLFA